MTTGYFSRAILVALALAIAPAGALARGLLDGMVFKGEKGPAGQAADELDEVISFRDGKFHSSACDKYGFGLGEYTAVRKGEAIVFQAETMSEKHGKLRWKGELKGEVLQGTTEHLRWPTWWRPSPEPLGHWFKASVYRR